MLDRIGVPGGWRGRGEEMGKNEKAAVVMFVLEMDGWIAKLEDQTQAVRGRLCEFMRSFKNYLNARVEDAEARGVRACLRRITSRLTACGG